MTVTEKHGLYGVIPAGLADAPSGAEQFSPLIPGSWSLESVAEESLASMTVLAPPGTLERRYVLALSLRSLGIGGTLVALAPRNRGGTRLRGELEEFGVAANETARAHFRLCEGRRPRQLAGIAEAVAAGGLQFVAATGLWSQPGIFGWDRIDAGSRLLVEHLPDLHGRGADLGCGTGYLARKVLASKDVESLALADIDRRAVAAARRNVVEPRAGVHWTDATAPIAADLDFVVTNPPFHEGGTENRALGLAVARSASGMLKKGGELWLVANRHLPYAPALRDAFAGVATVAQDREFTVYRAIK
ncbi:MAG: methyltransferase [Rhizomicrobium sp.]